MKATVILTLEELSWDQLEKFAAALAAELPGVCASTQEQKVKIVQINLPEASIAKVLAQHMDVCKAVRTAKQAIQWTAPMSTKFLFDETAGV